MEYEFLCKIDCCFPYHDEVISKKLISEGVSISPNIAFAVLHELVRVPESKKVVVSADTIHTYINHWSEVFSHPLKPQVLEAGYALVEGKRLPAQRSIEIMKHIEKFKDEYAALSIPYFACDDAQGLVDDEYNRIVESWFQ